METNTDRIPEDVTELERWAAESWGITTLEAHYEMTGADTADTYVTLTPWTNWGEKVKNPPRKIRDYQFKQLFKLELDHNTIARPRDEVVRKYAARKAYEAKHKKELAEYQRLRVLFG